jgi:hypothetical protein
VPSAVRPAGGRQEVLARFAGALTDFGKLIANETEKWAKVVKFAGLKAD